MWHTQRVAVLLWHSPAISSHTSLLALREQVPPPTCISLISMFSSFFFFSHSLIPVLLTCSVYSLVLLSLYTQLYFAFLLTTLTCPTTESGVSHHVAKHGLNWNKVGDAGSSRTWKGCRLSRLSRPSRQSRRTQTPFAQTHRHLWIAFIGTKALNAVP